MNPASRFGSSLRRILRRHTAIAACLELALVPLLGGLVLVGLGVTLWTQPHTPDSEFYFTLAAFGNDVTRDAVETSYFWTRLGVILPLRGLISAFGVEGGYRIWHLALLAIALMPSYLVIRRLFGRLAAAGGASFILLNLVFLSVIGNPYVTSAVVPLLIAECALLASAVLEHSPRMRARYFLLAGATAGWIAACNQLAAILAVLLYTVSLMYVPRGALRKNLSNLAAACWAAASVFLVFVFIGAMVFPEYNWWTTTRYWLGVLKPDDYHSDNLTWLWTNPALLVPLVPTLTLLIVRVPREGTVRSATALVGTQAGAGILFGIWYQFVTGGGFLEFQAYSPYLWGPGLLAGAVLVGMLVERCEMRVVGLVGVLAGLLGGAWVTVGDGFRLLPWGGLLAAVALATTVTALGVGSSRQRLLMPIACLTLPFVVQYLQSGTPKVAGLKFGRVEYNAVLRGHDYRSQYMQNLNIARWVLAQNDLKRYMVWTSDLAIASPAAMFFFGPNSAAFYSTLEPQAAAGIKSRRPAHVIMFAHQASELDDIRRNLRMVVRSASPGPCSVFAGADDTAEVHVCVSRVSVK